MRGVKTLYRPKARQQPCSTYARSSLLKLAIGHRINKMARCVLYQPARCPCFYGYVICVVYRVVQMQVQIGTSSFFVFVVPFMLVDPQLDLTPGSLGGMYAVGGLLGALVAPFFGRLVDKLGSRVCLPLGFIGLSIALQVLSNASNTSMVMAGFFGCRLFAIGALNPWSQVTINQWFDRKRGRVMGIMMVTTTFIRSGPYAVVYEAAISAFGWRTTQRYGSHASVWLHWSQTDEALAGRGRGRGGRTGAAVQSIRGCKPGAMVDGEGWAREEMHGVPPD